MSTKGGHFTTTENSQNTLNFIFWGTVLPFLDVGGSVGQWLIFSEIVIASTELVLLWGLPWSSSLPPYTHQDLIRAQHATNSHLDNGDILWFYFLGKNYFLWAKGYQRPHRVSLCWRHVSHSLAAFINQNRILPPPAASTVSTSEKSHSRQIQPFSGWQPSLMWNSPGCTKRLRTSSSGWCRAPRSIICGPGWSIGSRHASRTSGPRRRFTSSAASRLASTCPLGMSKPQVNVKLFSYLDLLLYPRLLCNTIS